MRCLGCGASLGGGSRCCAATVARAAARNSASVRGIDSVLVKSIDSALGGSSGIDKDRSRKSGDASDLAEPGDAALRRQAGDASDRIETRQAGDSSDLTELIETAEVRRKRSLTSPGSPRVEPDEDEELLGAMGSLIGKLWEKKHKYSIAVARDEDDDLLGA